MTTAIRPVVLGVLSATPLITVPAWSQSPPPTVLPTVNITGYAESVDKSDLSSDPAAGPASVSVLRLPDEKKRNTRDYTELLKPIMGVASNNFDQGGIGFGLTMRGFSERSNGGNVAVSIDGVPVNLPSHALTNGYADLTPLVPELLNAIVVTRGPFDVRFGANSLGGSTAFTTQDAPGRGAALSVGSYDYARLFTAVPIETGAVSGYLSLAGSTTSGYRDNAFLDVINSFNKFNFAMPGGTGSVRVQAFTDRFGAPGFIRRELVESGALRPETAINPTDGGNTDLYILAFNYVQNSEQPWSGSLYAMHSELDRYSNRQSTVPISPDLPGQALQVDQRMTVGGSIEKYLRWGQPASGGVDLLLGAGVRADRAESRIFNTIRRVPTSQTENTDFDLVNPFVYAQANYKPVPWAKLTAGVRYDQLAFDIDDKQRNLKVSPDFGVVQPKAGIVVSPMRGFDIFANYGRGFLPPSATGGQLSRNPDLQASELSTREIGVQWRSADGRWYVLADVYHTTYTNEILNQNPPLLPIYLGPSTRDGYDVELRVRPWNDGPRALSFFVNYSAVDGELVNRASGTSIPDVAEWFAKYGVDLAVPLRGGERLTFSAAQLWEGPKPINTTNTLSTKTYSRIDLKASYTNDQWKGFSAYLGAIVYPDRRLDETAFTFGTPVTVGVSPKAPLTVQVGVYVPF